jgi:phosphoglycerate dehydrogenase-like enzyme
VQATDPPKITVGPHPAPPWLTEAVVDGGGMVVDPIDAEAIVWADVTSVDELARVLDAAPNARWVQLPFAGVERFSGLLDQDRTWTCGKGVYADPVAEIALALGLAGLRNIHTYAAATSWSDESGRSLFRARVTIVGGGGIAESLIRLLQPFDCHITVVRANVDHMDGVDDVVEADHLADALPGADLVVLALALTPETEGLIGADELSLMEPHAWIVNVARGRHIVTDDLVDALRAGTIGGAGLEVTDPEPLPDGHPLWTLDNCIITPHTGTTHAMGVPLLVERVRDNVHRFATGQPLVGLVDVRAGY